MFRTVARLCVRDVENIVIKRNEEIKKIVKYYLKDMNNKNRQTVIDIIVTAIKQEFVIANSVIDEKVQEIYDAIDEQLMVLYEGGVIETDEMPEDVEELLSEAIDKFELVKQNGMEIIGRVMLYGRLDKDEDEDDEDDEDKMDIEEPALDTTVVEEPSVPVETLCEYAKMITEVREKYQYYKN